MPLQRECACWLERARVGRSRRRNVFLARFRARLLLVNIAELEAELLKLAATDRARLAEKLLESLETLTEEEAEQVWLEEAHQRDAALESGSATGRPAEDVLRDARARLG